MAYKYLNDNGLKAYTKKIKGALKDLHTPIAISTLNTAESKAQNVRNIADFVAKAKAAGITDVDGMAVTCLLSSGYSGVGYLHFVDGNYTLQGVEIQEELERSTCFLVWDDGSYKNTNLITGDVTSQDLTRGARKPIILTTETTEVDEETYQKLLVDDVDVVFKDGMGNLCTLAGKEDIGSSWKFYFTVLSGNAGSPEFIFLSAYGVKIVKNGVHKCTIDTDIEWKSIDEILAIAGYLKQSVLTPVLKEIGLTGTDAERKAKLDKFAADWKALTGASDLSGARFVGKDENFAKCVFTYDANNNAYRGLSAGSEDDDIVRKIYVDCVDGTIYVTPLFSHLEPVEIFSDNSAASKQKNIDNLNAYKANLEQLGVDTSKSFQVPFQKDGGEEIGVLYYSAATGQKEYVGISFSIRNTSRAQEVYIDSTGRYTLHLLAFDSKVELIGQFAQAVNAFGAIELKASDNAANKAALTAYKKILTDAGISITNGYSVPVRITGNAQEYHGMLNISTGTLLSGIVTDVNETHHYPFKVSTADGAITFDANNYFLEKTSNEVTEMFDAIKYSYTPVPLTATTSTNKTQLDLFLSKVPNAQVMHCTYKDVYAGTLHKIGTDWFGLLVKNTNNYEDALQLKLQADGTLIEGTTSLAQVNTKLANIIG